MAGMFLKILNGVPKLKSVLSEVLEGLSTATATAVTAADSILSAIGKLQAQINNLGLSDLTEKSFNSLTDKPSIPSSHTELGDIGDLTHVELEAEISDIQDNHVGDLTHFRLSPNYYSNRNPFLGDSIYISDLYNILYAADKQFTVTQTGMQTANLQLLFQSNYEYYDRNIIAIGTTATININFNAKTGNRPQGISYTQGYLYVTFYANRKECVTSVRYQDLDLNWISVSGNGENVSNRTASGWCVLRFEMPNDTSMINLEITFTSPSSANSECVLEALEYILKRPGANTMSFLSKLSAETLYYKTSWNNSNNDEQASVSTDGTLSGNNLNLTAKSQDEADPPPNKSVIWHSDGTDSGNDGDIMLKITDSAGITKTTTWVDYSAL